jgi:hypothetical protein
VTDGAPRLLDLCCGAGGASDGYDRAGWDAGKVAHIHALIIREGSKSAAEQPMPGDTLPRSEAHAHKDRKRLAKSAGVSRQFIREAEGGHRFEEPAMRRLCAELGTSYEYWVSL